MQDVDQDSVRYFSPPKTEYRLQIDDIVDVQITSEDPRIAALFSKSYMPKQNTNQQIQAGIGGDPFYLTGYIVDDSGYINLPALGKIEVFELTIAELHDEIEHRLLEYFNPGKYYLAVKLGGLRFSVFGDVTSPGRYVVLERNYNIYQVLAEFGDMTTFAKRNDVYIMRKKKGDLEMKRIDLLGEDIFESEYFYIMPNDVIYVRPVKIKALGFEATFLQNFSTTLSFVTSSLLLVVTLRQLNQQ